MRLRAEFLLVSTFWLESWFMFCPFYLPAGIAAFSNRVLPNRNFPNRDFVGSWFYEFRFFKSGLLPICISSVLPFPQKFYVLGFLDFCAFWFWIFPLSTCALYFLGSGFPESRYCRIEVCKICFVHAKQILLGRTGVAGSPCVCGPSFCSFPLSG